MNTRKIYILVLFHFLILPLFAQDFYNEGKDKSFEHKIVAGFNLGATAPLPLPAEVRSIKAWWPQFTPQLGYEVIYRFDESQWGIGSGILLNFKGMGVKDEVKYMHTKVELEKNSGQKLEGYFVGKNKTTVKVAYVTVPVYASFRPNKLWSFRAGGYASYNFSSHFNGTVSDGYMRVGTYTGDKMIIDEATFNFDEDVRTFDFGLTVGAERRINNRFGVYGNLDWGLQSIFPSSFRPMEFDMYNIYLALGLTYRLK